MHTTKMILTVLACLSLGLAACDKLDCGTGTHQEGDQCFPNLAVNCSGDLVEFRDGRCVPRAGVCGENTSFDFETMQCVAEAPSNNTPDPDLGNPEDLSAQDITDDVTAPDMDDMGQDTAPDLPEVPTCEDPADGTLCLSGSLLNFATGMPVETEEPLAVLIDDLFQRGAQPLKDPFAATLVSDSYFVLQDVPLQSDQGPLQQMILIAGSATDSPDTAWQRSLTGVLEVPAEEAVLENQVAFVVPSALVTRWDELLGDQIQGTLGREQGFFLVRLLSNDMRQPIAGASLRFVDPQQDANYQKLYLSDDLASFRNEESTGASGAVLVIGPPGVGSITADAPGRSFAPIPGGVNPGVAVTAIMFGFTP